VSIGDFELVARDGGARAGVLETAHGVVETPVFMPVGTKASVKALLPAELRDLGTQIVLGNTYHLHFRPGADLIADLGGLHRFMAWDGPILTDSGGFQVFSLRHTADRVDDDGVTFQSVYDGSRARLTPELAMEVQRQLGSDIAMAFDECTRADVTPEQLAGAVRRTARRSARPGSWCSASCRGPPTWRCGSAARPTSLASDLTAMRSAACRWGRSAG
jgi:queuine tRNA-ribosyltransferase